MELPNPTRTIHRNISSRVLDTNSYTATSVLGGLTAAAAFGDHLMLPGISTKVFFRSSGTSLCFQDSI